MQREFGEKSSLWTDSIGRDKRRLETIYRRVVVITYKRGNLLDTPDRVIVHGCNAHGVMGAGVALAIKHRWPTAFNVYAKMHHETGELKLGTLIRVDCVDKEIINCITQHNYGRGAKLVSYDAVDACMVEICSKIENADISMPKIGAGLGGGHWPVIAEIINFRLSQKNVTVWHLD